MYIPSKKECYRLIYDMQMLEHIVAHSLLVSQVAVFLTDQLARQQIALNRPLVEAAAMLHDITKTRSFKTGENHAQSGDEFLSAMGYSEVGSIVGQHVRLEVYFQSEALDEAEVVNYADKRVLHDQVVSLEERMIYIKERYGRKPQFSRKLDWIWRKTEEIETRIFRHLPFTPEDLTGLLNPRDCRKALEAYQAACEKLAGHKSHKALKN
jgi:putative nucleotidyltransferase with HDIG domain